MLHLGPIDTEIETVLAVTHPGKTQAKHICRELRDTGLMRMVIGHRIVKEKIWKCSKCNKEWSGHRVHVDPDSGKAIFKYIKPEPRAEPYSTENALNKVLKKKAFAYFREGILIIEHKNKTYRFGAVNGEIRELIE